MSYALGTCKDDHNCCNGDAIAFYEVYNHLQARVDSLVDSDVKTRLSADIKETLDVHTNYISHLIRTRHQNDYFKYVMKNMQPGEVVVIIDYKMKLELGIRTREIQRDWYGKRGISIHGCLVIAQLSGNERRSEVIDLWSEDTKQDAWFSQSALDVVLKWMEKELPGFSIYLFSDNGPHYHNTAFLMYLTEVNSKFNLTLAEYNYFEAGEGKSALDTHFAHISHKIVRWVRVGNNLETENQLGDLIASMKNVTCRQLIIDHSKAPKNVGTLKNISLYGNYSFPTTGNLKGGLIARSLAGIGNKLEKTKEQCQKLAGRESSIAGETGAAVREELPISGNITQRPNPIQVAYSVNFIQHPPDTASSIVMKPLDQQIKAKLPKPGYAIKKGGGTRVTFSQGQKDIMIEFYNRQANYGVRADPREVIKEMEERGMDVMRENQIKSWWSSYHQKRKKELQRMAEQITNLQRTNTTSTSITASVHTPTPSAAAGASSSPAPFTPLPTSAAMTSTLPSSAAAGTATTQSLRFFQNPQPVSASLAPQSSSPVLTCSSATSTSPGAPLPTATASATTSSRSQLLGSDTGNGIVEWYLPRTICQSSLHGRNGSNACTLIAMNFGLQYQNNNLGMSCSGCHLHHVWRSSLVDAITTGNELHDELFDGEAINLAVDEAIDAAGDQCKVQGITSEYNVFGSNPQSQFKNTINSILQEKESFHVLLLHDMAMLPMVDKNGTLILVDSHKHDRKGALIAACRPHINQGYNFTQWFCNMLDSSFNLRLSLYSISTITYSKD